ncbi:MAG TPA: acyl-CoA dehydrogenase family protein [Actinophytocola sp.]|uniref:acyl-CoA dehydrogenase family protein n=1 Tax=Actinophytocola sp. TaxID=1872138 RepID=UPI002E0486C2|nr:acyl-CoA dehydrogenase family protein [Actinophytocola sp.]
MTLLREHFAAYRPLVTATALGGAAAVFDTVTTVLSGRQAAGDLPWLRDSALITLGHAHAQLTTALLGTAAAAHLADSGFDQAETWSCAMKAHGIDTAYRAVAELGLLLGATGYRADSPVAKTHRDLGGLLYADGIHDSLYRTAGKHHTASGSPFRHPGPSHPGPPSTDQAIRPPWSHSAVTPCSTASSATAMRSASSGFTRSRASSSV